MLSVPFVLSILIGCVFGVVAIDGMNGSVGVGDRDLALFGRKPDFLTARYSLLIQ